MPRPKAIKSTRQEIPKLYCRKCKKSLNEDSFYQATNPMLDSNGKMSICILCCNEIYDMYFSIYNNLEIALQLTCEDLDVRFSKEALIQAKSHIESLVTKGKVAEKVFGYYKSKLGSTNKNSTKMESFRYKDSDCLESIENNIVNEEIDDDLLLFWGKSFDEIDDYIFLESELSNWKKTHKCDNQAEITLLREICIKILEIRKARDKKENVSDLQKGLQDLMKTANVDPAKANAASAGKSKDCFGVWVKDIEQFKPAEWYEQQEKYKDIDGFVPYIKNYIVRPIENFLTGVRNFFVNDNIDADLDSVDIGSVDTEGDFNG
jgi:hypothetical protein